VVKFYDPLSSTRLSLTFWLIWITINRITIAETFSDKTRQHIKYPSTLKQRWKFMYLHTDLTNIDMHPTAYTYTHTELQTSLLKLMCLTVLPSLCSIKKKTTHPNHKTNLPALSFSGGFDK